MFRINFQQVNSSATDHLFRRYISGSWILTLYRPILEVGLNSPGPLAHWFRSTPARSAREIGYTLMCRVWQ